MKRTLGRIKDDESWFLDYLEDYDLENLREGIDYQTNGVPPLTELADFCDQNAESRNNHEYVGTHRILAALLYQELGQEQATRILYHIAEYGGLDAMNGAGGETSAFADFGIRRCWSDWALTGEETCSH